MVIASYAASRRVVLLRLAALSPVVVLVSGLIDLLTTTQGPMREVLFVAFVGIGTFYAYYFGFHQIYLVELTPVELRGGTPCAAGRRPSATCSPSAAQNFHAAGSQLTWPPWNSPVAGR